MNDRLVDVYKGATLPAVLALGLGLTGCSDGGSSSSDPGGDDNPHTGSVVLSGTAAAGAPISGFVAAQGRNGEYVATNLDSDGSYTLDLDGLAEPYLVYASGLSGGRAYTLLSVASDNDLGQETNTLNITPLTDLIVGSVTGTNPTEFFLDPDYSKLGASDVDDQEARIRGRILPVMEAIQGDDADSFNLRNSAFQADRSGFDGVLDLLRVEVDGTGVSIENRVDGETLSDDLINQDDSAMNVGDSVPLADARAVVAAIDETFTALIDLIANGTLTKEDVEAHIDPDFLMNDFPYDEVVTWLTNDIADTAEQEEALRVFRNFSLFSLVELGDTEVKIDYSGEETAPLVMRRDEENDRWRFAGNQREWFGAVRSRDLRFVGDQRFDDDNTKRVSTLEFEFGLEEADFYREGGTLRLSDPQIGKEEEWTLDEDEEGGDFEGTLWELTDEDINTIEDGQIFTFTYEDEDGTGEETELTVRLLKAPVGPNDARLHFPEFANPTAENLRDFVNGGGELEVEWSLPAGYRSGSLMAERWAGDDVHHELEESEVELTDAQTSATMSLQSPDDGEYEHKENLPADGYDRIELMLSTFDAFGREIQIVLVGREQD